MHQEGKALQGKKIWFRADASVQIGSGHVMRCVTLAKQCRLQGAEVTFFCRKAAGDMQELITREEFALHSLPSIADISTENPTEMLDYLSKYPSPDWLIVDHYSIDHRWESEMRKWVDSLFVIDDLANRRHDCVGLLDQNLQPAMELRYKELVPNNCKIFLGPSYAILRDEFHIRRAQLRKRDGQIHRILVSFGGSDPTGESQKVIQALKGYSNMSIHVDLVAGHSNENVDWLISEAKATPHIHVHRSTNAMASLMAQADIAIGAGGTTTWERLYMGLPSAVVIVADNQRTMTEEAERRQLCWNLGDSASVTTDTLRTWLESRLHDSGALLAMSERALSAMPYIPEGSVSPLIHFLKGE